MVNKKKNWDKFFLPIVVCLFIYAVSHMHYFFSFRIYNFPTGIREEIHKKYTVLLISSTYSLAENQESFHNCKAINNLGSDCYIFEYNNTPNYSKFLASYLSQIQKIVNYFIKPDFIFYNCPGMLFEDSDYIKYSILDVAHPESVALEAGEEIDPKSVHWLSLYKGFVVYGDNRVWVKKLVTDLKKKNNNMTLNFLYDYYPSVPKTEFIKSARNKLFYSGSNWDDRRKSDHYKDIHKLLDKKDYFAVYGPDKSWTFLQNSYKGSIEFDDHSLIQTMQQAGIALLFHTDYHRKYGIPSKRVFEAAAASNVIISDRNPFIVREFGECVYYIDPLEEPNKVVAAIDRIVQLVKSDPELANSKAECVHNIFLNKFTLEDQWIRIFKMHEEVVKSLATN